MTDKDTALLEKANRLYPPGTQYYTAAEGGDMTIRTANRDAYFWQPNRIAVGDGQGLVYFKGKWAKIIKPAGSPELPSQDNYLTIS